MPRVTIEGRIAVLRSDARACQMEYEINVQRIETCIWLAAGNPDYQGYVNYRIGYLKRRNQELQQAIFTIEDKLIALGVEVKDL